MLESAFRHPFPTCDGVTGSVKRRKLDMLESALRHPFPGGTSCTSTAAAAPQAAACSREDAEEADRLYEAIPVTRQNHDQWEEVDWRIFTLLWANDITAEGFSSWARAENSDMKQLANDWDAAHVTYRDGVLLGFVMGRKAVARAVALWDSSRLRDEDRTTECHRSSHTDQEQSCERATGDVEHLTRVVRAAAREGEGVIVHPWCLVGRHDTPEVFDIFGDDSS